MRTLRIGLGLSRFTVGHDRAAGKVRDHDEDESMDGAASVTGMSDVSGGGSGTTRIDNTRK
jgi:hypothetical protein